MNSTGLILFRHLCELGNALEALRDVYPIASDEWLWHTDLLAELDGIIDMLVHSPGLDDDNDEPGDA